jgi:hypothetical protein
MDKIQFFFPEELANVIHQIPISKYGAEDFASWPLARFGMYTVRSAYNMARTNKFFSKHCVAGHGGSSELEEHSKRWKSIWAIQSRAK